MHAYETPGQPGERHSFADSIKELPGYIDQKLPTRHKSLDRYFDQSLPDIIDEWGLISRMHLAGLERRLSRVHAQIDYLEKNRAGLEERAENLDMEIRTLEGV